MKKLLIFLLALLLCVSTSQEAMAAEGWPANYGGVMLQGFYWDGFTDAQWSRLEKQVDNLSTTFDLVWIPQSANCGGQSMGYDDLYWFSDYNSSFGTAEELKSMIQTFKAKGIGTIADIVINHRKNVSNWVDFPAETYKGVTYQLQSTDICANDDGGKAKTEAAKLGLSVSSNNDTGEDWGGMRDLDHKSENVQKNVKAYLKMLLEDFGYIGFRYDMVKGYSGSYTKMYNEDANPQFSVGECWDSSNTIKNWIDATDKTSAAFDFQFRYTVRNAIKNSDWTLLGKQNDGNWPLVSSSFNSGSYRQYAVTFVENHDTEYRSASAPQDPIRKDTLAANAYLLAMPGTPCVFLKHWQAYKQEIANMATVRKAVGITNTSTPQEIASQKDYYAVEVTGTNGKLLAVVGTKAADYTPDGDWQKAISGYHYVYYVSGINPESITYPEFAKSDFKPYTITIGVNTDQVGWTDGVNFWTWGGDGSHAPSSSSWPGDNVTETMEVGGKTWYTKQFSINDDADAVSFVFSTGSGSPQTVDVTNVSEDKFFEISSEKDGDKYLVNDVTSTYTGIRSINAQTDGYTKVYTLDGRLIRTAKSKSEAVNGLPKGIYIINKAKFILK